MRLESRSGLTAGPQARSRPAQAGAALGGDGPPFTSERGQRSLWLRAQVLVPPCEESSSLAGDCEPGAPCWSLPASGGKNTGHPVQCEFQINNESLFSKSVSIHIH